MSVKHVSGWNTLKLIGCYFSTCLQNEANVWASSSCQVSVILTGLRPLWPCVLTETPVWDWLAPLPLYMLARVVRSYELRVPRWSRVWKGNVSSRRESRREFLSVTSEQNTQAKLLFSVWARSSQCGQRAAEHNGRENRGARGSRDGEERVGEQIGPEMRGRGAG